ncbi:MAG: hypothetical protein ACRDNJ_15215 [Solirubrobacteraceae bacterium]
MDPIHPIVPQIPSLPPVSEPPAVQRLRDDAQRRRETEQRERRRRERERGGQYANEDLDDGPLDDGDDEGHPHVDVTV